MNMATHSCSGRCLRGHYAMNGNYVGGGCGCPKYTKEHVLVPDPALEVALSTSSPSSEHERSSRTDVGVEAGQLELKMDAT
jgi:hypothetical protein